MQPCWCPHGPVLCSQGGRSSCSLTMTPWLPTAGLMQRLQTLDTQLDCGSCNPIPAFSNREWGPYDCTLSSARLWLGLPCDAIQIQSSLQKPTWKQPLWNLHGGVQSMPFPHILSQNLRWGKNSAGFWNQFEQESGLSKPNKSLQFFAQAVCTLFAENRENCMFLIIFKLE